MFSFIRYTSLLSLVLLFATCQNKEKNEGKKLAQLGEKALYLSEIKDIMPSNMKEKDSIDFVKTYVEKWIRKQLLYQEAAKNAQIDEKDLQKRLEEYKYALLTHEFEKQYVAKNFSDKVLEEEIKEFYEKNKQEFELRQNIVKAIFIKLDAKSKEKDDFIKLMPSDKPEEKKELLELCNEKAASYYLQDTTWIDFDELVRLTPFEGVPNKISFLKNNRFSQMQEGEFVYLLQIKEYKISEQTSPLEFVKERIRSMILNQRKTTLIKKLEDELYKKAQNNKEFQIFLEAK
ncbi:MAG: peptidylprolyl isomerase [Raineya sp.]